MAIATNKKVYHDYEIIEKFVAGLVLTGPEVKAVKNGQVNIKGSYASIAHGEVWLKQAYISAYSRARNVQAGYDPYQNRKLLLQAKEIKYLIGKTAIKGISLLPLKIINKGGLIKVELGLGRGKRKADKREAIKKRDFERRKNRLIKTGLSIWQQVSNKV